MFVHLSHKLDPEDRAFPGEATLEIRQDRLIGEDGKPFNSVLTTLPNHVGTHMDGPHHFNTVGTNFDELPIELFAYEGGEVLVVDLPHRGDFGEVVLKEDIEPFADQLKGKRLLLIRTGFEKYKFTEPDRYAAEGVSLHPDFCRYLNEEFPDLVCLGMDFLSVASPTNDYGVEAHHWLLGNYNDHLICAIEDMALADLGDHTIKLITLGPLRVKGIDSSQVCAMAWVE
ncbi:MAG: cyclase family protein [Actinomycetaceae bacterium]|nr:cyclase family protein [Actinomycetaceae bacterium]